MASTSYNWPVNSSTVTATNPSIGVTGITAPTSAGEIGFIDGSGNLQPLTGTVAGGPIVALSNASLPLPTGAATAALQTTGNTSLSSIDTKLSSQATAANQTTANTSLASIVTNTGKIPSQGAALTAASLPVNIASDQVVPVSATALPLPAGAATSALQTTGNTSLATIATNTPTVGQKAMAGSSPVVIASDQSSFPVTVAAGTAIIGKVSIDQTTPGTTNGVQVNAALPAGSNIIGNVRIDQTTPGTTNGVQVNAALPVGANVIGKVSIDQSTPGTTNLVALAANQSVNVAQINGVTPLMGAGNTGTGSQRVTIATDQVAVATKSPVNVNGGNGRISNLTTAAQTLTAPANTVGFILQAEAANTDFVRWVMGTTATSSVGQQLQPGQDSGYVPCFKDISIIANSGSNQAVNVIWILSA